MTKQLTFDVLSDSSLYDERLVYNLPHPDPETPTLTVRRLGIVAMELKKTPFNSAAKGLVVDEASEEVVDLKKRLRDTLETYIWQGYRHFFTSATQGVELWAAEIILDLQEEYPGIALEVVVPYDRHSMKWSEETRDRYDDVCSQADILTTIRHDYTSGAIFARNKYLMDACHALMAIYMPETNTATEQFARRAQWNGKQVCRVPLLRPERSAA